VRNRDEHWLYDREAICRVDDTNPIKGQVAGSKNDLFVTSLCNHGVREGALRSRDGGRTRRWVDSEVIVFNIDAIRSLAKALESKLAPCIRLQSSRVTTRILHELAPRDSGLAHAAGNQRYIACGSSSRIKDCSGNCPS